MTPDLSTAALLQHSEQLLFLVLLQLTLIVLAARLGGIVARRYFGQTPVIGEILVGILLGPSLFGALAPEWHAALFSHATLEPMQIMAQIGLILLMFQIGLEFDFSQLTRRSNRRAVLLVALASLLLPFGLGLLFGYYGGPFLAPGVDPLACALFVATAFSITAMPILGRIMIDLRLNRLSIGVIAISAAAINDLVGWLLLAVVIALTLANFSFLTFSAQLLLTLLFLLFCWLAVRPALKWLVAKLQRSLQKHPDGGTLLDHNLLSLLLAAIFVAAMATTKLGLFAMFGAFVLGMLLHDEEALVTAWEERIGALVQVFFLPVFFTFTGLRTDLGTLQTGTEWSWCLLLILLATVGKFAGSYFAARAAGLGHTEGNILGIMMNTRGLMELVVINIGYDLGILSPALFTMLVLMALFSTVITAPVLRYWIKQLGSKASA